eukprot:CAMPEP_0198315072 /NCGR_PEP_ID=MMETSP1450-20131203/5478_1 /TAXON_ID=753684 ORGANISM="Madagascaria erythrocladiodes, Strain CCMP3234" /NCGR_SAMPLE_ID=MMETSP1450 /ASSEMBLY_ACC=CAM_ASM_001115 /LENGTH=138 /DNA_ID=CAMNT_0044018167 /DNA_START=75 /DNA_END=491 /DNA_ORIENTATION=+
MRILPFIKPPGFLRFFGGQLILVGLHMAITPGSALRLFFCASEASIKSARALMRVLGLYHIASGAKSVLAAKNKAVQRATMDEIVMLLLFHGGYGLSGAWAAANGRAAANTACSAIAAAALAAGVVATVNDDTEPPQS